MREKLIELQDRGNICPKGITSCLDCPYQKVYAFGIPCDEKAAIADRMIANGVTIQKWIPVSERLPTKEDARIMGEYLPAIERGKKPNIWKWTEVAKHPEYFTHWMPLPPAPEDMQ